MNMMNKCAKFHTINIHIEEREENIDVGEREKERERGSNLVVGYGGKAQPA